MRPSSLVPPRFSISAVCVDRQRLLPLDTDDRRPIGLHLDVGTVVGGAWMVEDLEDVRRLRSQWAGWMEVHLVDPSGMRPEAVHELLAIADQLLLAPALIRSSFRDPAPQMAAGRLTAAFTSKRELREWPVQWDAAWATVMTTDLGQAGGPFAPARLAMVESARGELPGVSLQADGCVGPETISRLATSGCDRFVLGRSALPVDLVGLDVVLDRLDGLLASVDTAGAHPGRQS